MLMIWTQNKTIIIFMQMVSLQGQSQWLHKGCVFLGKFNTGIQIGERMSIQISLPCLASAEAFQLAISPLPLKKTLNINPDTKNYWIWNRNLRYTTTNLWYYGKNGLIKTRTKWNYKILLIKTKTIMWKAICITKALSSQWHNEICS